MCSGSKGTLETLQSKDNIDFAHTELELKTVYINVRINTYLMKIHVRHIENASKLASKIEIKVKLEIMLLQ